MQIVIDIPKHAYDYIMGSGYFPSNFNMISEIRNGILLPKGHGRLKDVNKFLERVKKDREHEIYLRSWTADDVIDYLSSDSYAPIVIKADTGGEEV